MMRCVFYVWVERIQWASECDINSVEKIKINTAITTVHCAVYSTAAKVIGKTESSVYVGVGNTEW